MSFVPLVDAWHESEETRTRLRPGRRWFRMEKELGDGAGLADMTRNRHHWRFHETPDGVARVRELWAWFPDHDDARDHDDTGEHGDGDGPWAPRDTVLVDGFDDEFPDPATGADRDTPQDGRDPWAGLQDTVARAGDAVDYAHPRAGDAGDADGDGGASARNSDDGDGDGGPSAHNSDDGDHDGLE